jgi:hypothetical protein
LDFQKSKQKFRKSADHRPGATSSLLVSETLLYEVKQSDGRFVTVVSNP